MEQIFKVGDTVYHWNYGVGRVVEVYDRGTFSVKVMFEDNNCYFSLKGQENEEELPTLSHTPYNLIDGGFSQRKPLPNIKKGTPVYIKMPASKMWVVRVFSHFSKRGKICTFEDSKLEGKTNDWDEYSLENPIKYNEE